MNISVEELKENKDSLMRAFRGHIRNIKKSEQFGARTNEVYKPVWFVFDLMQLFLRPTFECRVAINTETDAAILMASILPYL